MPKEIPILFSTAMVQAILAGRKTETRRVVKPQPIDNREVDGNFFEGNHKGYVKVDGHRNWQEQFASEFSRLQPGDLLWVREKFSKGRKYPLAEYEPNRSIYVFQFAADKQPHIEGIKSLWKPSIHMPKDAARIWLEVVSVGIERLQDITYDAASDEGLAMLSKDGGRVYKYGLPDVDGLPRADKGEGWPWNEWEVSAKTAFLKLWAQINGPESVTANPWVWVVKFKVLSTTGKPTTI